MEVRLDQPFPSPTCPTHFLPVSLCLRLDCSSGGEDQAEPHQAEAGSGADGCEDRRGGAHAAAGQAQGEVQHDAGHARHQHP